MNKNLGILLLALDFLVMGLSGYILYERIRKSFQSEAPAFVPLSNAAPEPESSPKPQEEIAPPKETSVEKTAAKTAPVEQPIKKRAVRPQKISFSYRDAIPKRVSVIGDFNDWSPQLMKKDKTHLWSIALQIEPGNYAYNFVVDEKLIRDPSNPRKKKAGQKIPSSVLIVK